jgi:hypothetical protein
MARIKPIQRISRKVCHISELAEAYGQTAPGTEPSWRIQDSAASAPYVGI